MKKFYFKNFIFNLFFHIETFFFCIVFLRYSMKPSLEKFFIFEYVYIYIYVYMIHFNSTLYKEIKIKFSMKY